MFNLSKAKKIVIKIGSSSLSHATTASLDLDFIQKLTEKIVYLKKQGKEIILVTSGAILTGMGMIGLTSRPNNILEKRRLSSIGQTLLMMEYIKSFSRHKMVVGQILLTALDIKSPTEKNHLISLINHQLKHGDIPIVNENDATATEEIKIGDNDTLAAHVAVMIKADLLILLSDIDGLYDRDPTDPKAQIIKEVKCVTKEIKTMAGADNKRGLGTGGMSTKLKAGEICLDANIDMILMNAKNEKQWQYILNGKNHGGTLFSTRVN